MKFPFREIAQRLTGFSTPIFGVSWNPPTAEAEVARRLVTFLEDRRALYNPYDVEVMHDVVESVLRTRERLTAALEQLDRGSPLAQSIAALRAACRKFLDSVHGGPTGRSYWGPHMFDASALGELRGVFGIHLANICVRYGIDVEEELASIFPAAVEPDEKDKTLRGKILGSTLRPPSSKRRPKRNRGG
jgi:hypothetical protein